ncbi:MAG: hypothetical protein IZT59_01635 [Verrucomicrobia bacterium]|nr:hypothetical protein [Verrucomicrobiota bacterium]
MPESIPDVFTVPKFWIAEERKAVFRGIHRVDQDSRQGLRREISGDSCTEIGDWFSEQSPKQLTLRKASEWPGVPLQRITWQNPSTGRIESGVNAIAMALQHIHLGWAVVGWVASLPGISHTIQLCFDTAGAGKKD